MENVSIATVDISRLMDITPHVQSIHHIIHKQGVSRMKLKIVYTVLSCHWWD